MTNFAICYLFLFFVQQNTAEMCVRFRRYFVEHLLRVRRCVIAESESADTAPGALHVGLYEQRLGCVLANVEHSVARLPARAPLLRQGH